MTRHPSRDLLAALAIIALAIAASSCGAAAQEPAASDPLEVKLVNADECAPGWRLVSRDEGWTIYYPHPAGVLVPNWIDEDRLRAHFTRPDGRVAVEAFEGAKRGYLRQHRIICRWAPLGGEPA